MKRNEVPKNIKGYTILHSIGEGYSGEVYLAVKENEKFAIKIIKQKTLETKELRQKQLTKLELQVRIGLEINNPHIVKIYEGGFDDVTKKFFLVMEYIDSSLYFRLDEWSETIPKSKIRTLIAQITSAAKTLHDKSYIHRDIKPSNILISNDCSRAVLLDLGVMSKIEDLSFDSKNNELSDDKNKSIDYLTLRYAPVELLHAIQPDNYKSEALTFYQIGAIIYTMYYRKKLFDNVEDSTLNLLKCINGGIEQTDEIDLDFELSSIMFNLLNINWTERLVKVSWTDLNYVSYEPLIVFLYAGGTIGSTENSALNVRGVRTDSNLNIDFFDSISKRIQEDYCKIFEPEVSFPFSIKWESLNEEDVILSENATPKYWNALMLKIQFIIQKYYLNTQDCECITTNYYLSGIIILHGTDTLAYTASALNFGLRNIPCPIVITGSNQPPNENEITELKIMSSKSDVWKNLSLSVNFIRSFGHRYTEIYVAFNSTIFSAYNLKKSPLYNAFESGSTTEAPILEPYTYQNIYQEKKFCFKWIDGFFCNNCYPINGYNHDILRDGKVHTRRYLTNNEKTFNYTPYIEDLAELIICSPITSYQNLENSSKNIVILVGYESGTFPSIANHKLTDNLINATEKNKIIFLISDYGLFPNKVKYALDDYAKDKIKPIPIYGLIKETAIPFILSLLSSMNSREKSQKEIEELLFAKLDSKEWKNSLHGISIKNPLDPTDLLTIIKDKISSTEQFYHNNEESLFRGFENIIISDITKRSIGTEKDHLQENNLNDIEENKSSFSVRLTPEITLWFLLHQCKKAISLGYGPIAFEELNAMGFRFGRKFFVIISKYIKGSIIYDKDVWAELSEENQEPIFQRICTIVNDCKIRIKKIGLVAISDCRIIIDRENKCIKLDVKTKQNVSFLSDNIFSTKQVDERETNFFKQLRNGNPIGESSEQYYTNMESILRKLPKDTWLNPNIQPMEWFILGTFKGILVEALFSLKIDHWIKKYKDPINLKTVEHFLKNSIRTTIKNSEDFQFNFELTYFFRDE